MESERMRVLEELLRRTKSPGIRKSSILAEDPVALDFFEKNTLFFTLLETLNEEEKIALYTLVILGEGELLSPDPKLLVPLLSALNEIEQFYREEGGILGYLLLFLHTGCAKKCRLGWHFSSPSLRDLRERSNSLFHWVQRGISELPSLAAIYPVGGAGDRLSLIDPATGEPLPAGRLQFDGMTLLEGLFAQLAAFEYLYFKLEGEQVSIPVALMTSREKSNYDHIKAILEKSFWFHRDPSKIFISVQPLSPIVTKEGRLSFSSPMKLNLKPGGHGVIWKLLKQEGIFSKFLELGCTKAFVRQINNPLISLDYTLLAFIGCGFETGKTFGFLASERPVGIEEGMIVEKQRKVEGLFENLLTNVEYTDFAEEGLRDEPKEPGSSFSVYPTNTNVLFADLPRIAKLVEEIPLPGLVVNWKSSFPTLQKNGEVHEVKAGRLESTMQNIADALIVRTKEPLKPSEERLLPTFACFHPRQKTISTTKRSFVKGGQIEQTPEKAFWDLLANHRDLLTRYSGMQLPLHPSIEEFAKRGASFFVHYHPALGPLYSIIREKIQGGVLYPGAALELDIAELSLEEVRIEGSLVIRAVAPFGELGATGVLSYSNLGGKCSLKRVTVKNAGIERREKMWEGGWNHKEAVEILIHGDGEFHAEGITFQGAHRFEVPKGHRMVVTEGPHGLEVVTSKIKTPSWHWRYFISETLEITAERCYSKPHESRHSQSH